MKCPKLFKLMQSTYESTVKDIDQIPMGTSRTLFEIQDFMDCYKENCAYWDKENQCCKGINL